MAQRRRERILVLWNFVGEDEYERLRARGPKQLPWDPEHDTPDVETVSEEIESIVDAIHAGGHPVRAVNVEDDFDRMLDAIRAYRPHAIFNLIEFFNDHSMQEAWVAAIYGLMGVPYTGNTPLCLATCQRKVRTKVLLAAEGLPTPAFRLLQRLPVPKDLGLAFPLIVKPAREDASGGIDNAAVVRDQDELDSRVAYVLSEFHQPALVEQYIDGREIHVSILGNDRPAVLPLLEFEFDEPEDAGWSPQIVSYEAKWDPLSRDFYRLDAVVPARGLPRPIAKGVREAALAAYRALDCRDYARIDMRIDGEGAPYILEINPNPDLARGTGFALCAQRGGRSFEETVGEIVKMALDRRPSARRRGRASARASAR